MDRITRFAPVAVALMLLLLGLVMAGCGREDGPSSPARELSEEFLPPAPAGQAWKLAWSDEFEGATLDRSTWETPEGVRRDGYWAAEDSYLDGQGLLVIRTREQDGKFYSGAIRTRGKFEHRYGYWVCRCRFHTQPGHWPAFWLFSDPGVGQVGEEGRDGTEIDIMEKPWPVEDRVNFALHWDGYGEQHRSEGKQVVIPGLSQGFHTFGLDWRPEGYVFYIDGRESWRTAAGGVSQVPAYLKLTDEVGDWAGDIHDAQLPDNFFVDYVRVYDLADQ